MSIIDQTSELTEAQAFEAILQWSQDRPTWQRDALRRLITNGSLSEADFKELTGICCGGAMGGASLAKEHLKSVGSSGDPISLVRISGPSGVNALPSDQSLDFSRTGLS